MGNYRAMIFVLACLVGGIWQPHSVEAKKKSRKAKKIQVWKKVFSSKRPFGKRKKSKRRGKWVKVKSLRIKNKMLWEYFGKVVPIVCRLGQDDVLECEGRNKQGATLVQSSSKWPAGRVRLILQVRPTGMSMEMSNKWKRYVRTRRKPRKR